VFKQKKFFYPSLKKHNFFSYEHRILCNILKNFNAPVTIYLDSEHRELKQCNDRPTLDTKSCNDSGEGWGCLFAGVHVALKRWGENCQHKF